MTPLLSSLCARLSLAGNLLNKKIRGGLISAVNLSEVYYKAAAINKIEFVDRFILTAELQVVPFDHNQARIAADLFEKTTGQGVSFADRACLSLGIKTEQPVITGDRLWQTLDVGAKIVLFRPSVN